MKNKILLFLMIIFSFTLAACKKKDDKPLSDTEYYVYYINTAMDKLVENRYTVSLPSDDVDGLVDGNILYLNFDTNYQSMDVSREVLARAALAKTLTQIDGIDYISIRSGDQPLINALGENVGLISSSNFINSVSNVNSFEKATLTLYFADEEGTKLVPETREMFYDMNTSKERLIIDELMKGPTNTKLKATIPNDTKVISVTVNEGICYVNFDEGFLNALPDVLDSITIYSIVDSLSELPNISRVQILVNGKSDKNYNSISLGTSVERNLDYVKEEK